MPQKLYCYVDESGQHTQGLFFVASLVFCGSETERDNLERSCELIEERTGRGKTKWIETRYPARLAYFQEVLNNPAFEGVLKYAVYRGTKEYQEAIATTIARAFEDIHDPEYKAVVVIDGWPRSQEDSLGVTLRHLGVRLKKIRGLRDQTNSLIRLADATCGLVAANFEGQAEMVRLFNRAVRQGVLVDISGEIKRPR